MIEGQHRVETQTSLDFGDFALTCVKVTVESGNDFSVAKKRPCPKQIIRFCTVNPSTCCYSTCTKLFWRRSTNLTHFEGLQTSFVLKFCDGSFLTSDPLCPAFIPLLAFQLVLKCLFALTVAMSQSPSENESGRLSNLDPLTLEVITSYLPFASILHLVCTGCKPLFWKLTREGGVKSIDYGDGLKSFAGTSTFASLHYLARVTLPRPRIKVLDYRKSQFAHVSHLVLSQSINVDSVALNDLPSSLRSLIYDLRQWPKVGGEHGEWHEALPNLSSLAISFGRKTTSNAPELKTLLSQLPIELQALKVAYPGLFTPIYIGNLPPALTSFDFLRLNPTAGNAPIPQYLPLLGAEFDVELPSTITDLRLPTYILTDTALGWGFKNLPSLRRLHLSQVKSQARVHLPATITHLELIGELEDQEARDISFGWPQKLSTLSIGHNPLFEFSSDGSHLKAALPRSITHLIYFESPHVRKGPRALIAPNQLRHAFGDINNAPEPFLAAFLTCIELPTNFIAESQLQVVARCTWLRKVSVYDVTLCGASIPPDTTEITTNDQAKVWFWQYWGPRIPLVLSTDQPLAHWTTGYEAATKETRGRKFIPLPNTLRILSMRSHGFNYEQLPTSIEIAEDVFVIGEFKKSLPNLTKLGLIWKASSEVVELAQMLELAPKLTELSGAWLSIPSSFVAENIDFFQTASIITPQALLPSKTSKKTLDDYSMRHAQTAGELESEYGSSIPTKSYPLIAAPSSPPLPETASSSTTISSDALPQEAAALEPSNTLRIPEDIASSFVALARPLKLLNVSLGHTEILSDLTVPLPIFERFVFNCGAIAVSKEFIERGIPYGVQHFDAGTTTFLLDGVLERMPHLPTSLKSLAFTGSIASAFLFAPKTPPYDWSWIPSTVDSIHINDTKQLANRTPWVLSGLPASVTRFSVTSYFYQPIKPDMKALPSYLSERSWSGDGSTFIACIGEKAAKEKCSIS